MRHLHVRFYYYLFSMVYEVIPYESLPVKVLGAIVLPSVQHHLVGVIF